jgi:hypothetical protein
MMNDAISDQPPRPHDKLRAILTNPRSYPLEMTLVDGRKLRIARSKFIHFPPRMKEIVYFPLKKSDGLMDYILPDSVIKIRTLRKKRAA